MSFPVGKAQQKGRKSRAIKVKSTKPQLTSLCDMMTILLVFLIKTFSTEGNVMNIPNDIKLPVSIAQKAPKPTPILSVNQKYLVVEGVNVGSVKEVLESGDLLIQPLYDWLQERRNTTEEIAKYSTKTEFKGDITIQGDQKIPYKLLQKIMYTCGQTGFNNFSLAVLQNE
jgi:biopolymer transport protein ExbD